MKFLSWKISLVIYIISRLFSVILMQYSNNSEFYIFGYIIFLFSDLILILLIISIVIAIVKYRKKNKRIKKLVQEKIKKHAIDPDKNYQEYYKLLKEAEEEIQKNADVKLTNDSIEKSKENEEDERIFVK